MSRRDNADRRCAVCRMHLQLCLCPETPSLSTTSSLTLLLHREEQEKPTNSGALAARCLQQSRVVVVDPGDRDAAPFSLPPPWGTPPRRQLLLFPADDAVSLDSALDSVSFDGGAGGIDLVVPDGTWRQARKMRARLPGLSALPCVTLPTTVTTSWRLREERREHGLATLEAIAAAFRVLEGDAVADALLAVFRLQVDRTLWLRGALRDHEVSGGLPDAVRLHDPRGGIKKTP